MCSCSSRQRSTLPRTKLTSMDPSVSKGRAYWPGQGLSAAPAEFVVHDNDEYAKGNVAVEKSSRKNKAHAKKTEQTVEVDGNHGGGDKADEGDR